MLSSRRSKAPRPVLAGMITPWDRKVAAQAAAGSIKTWRVRIRPPSIRATSVPVTAAGPSGGPDCQRSRLEATSELLVLRCAAR